MCKFQSDCYIPKGDVVCVYPALDNETKLLQVYHGRKPPLLFLGHPLDLHYSGKGSSIKVKVYMEFEILSSFHSLYSLELFFFMKPLACLE